MKSTDQDGIAIAYIESCIYHNKKSLVKKFFSVAISLIAIVFGVNFILSIMANIEDGLFNIFLAVGLFLLFSMIILSVISDINYVLISRNIEKCLKGVLEYEISCAEIATSWHRFVFAHCLSKTIEKKSKNTLLLFSQKEDGEINIILEDEIPNYSVVPIWHLLCQKNFNDKNISIFDNSTYDVITFYLKDDKLKLLHLSMLYNDYQVYTVPSSFSKDFVEDTIFGNFITNAMSGWKNLEVWTSESDAKIRNYRKNVKSFLELLPK